MIVSKRPIPPAAIGLAIANLVTISVAMGAILFAERAWRLHENSLAAAVHAQSALVEPARIGSAASGPATQPTVHSPTRWVRATTMDRILLFGILGVTGSAFFTWRLVSRSPPIAGLPASPRLARRRAVGRTRVRNAN
jgi:hypothetical protein